MGFGLWFGIAGWRCLWLSSALHSALLLYWVFESDAGRAAHALNTSRSRSRSSSKAEGEGLTVL